LINKDETEIFLTDNSTNNIKDTDADGLYDYEEMLIFGTNPAQSDTDADGLSDYEETKIYLTYYLDQDSDDDLLIDSVEVKQYFTDPKNPDTDANGFTDYLEIISGTNPLDSISVPGYAHLFIAIFLIIVCYGCMIILLWE